MTSSVIKLNGQFGFLQIQREVSGDLLKSEIFESLECEIQIPGWVRLESSGSPTKNEMLFENFFKSQKTEARQVHRSQMVPKFASWAPQIDVSHLDRRWASEPIDWP